MKEFVAHRPKTNSYPVDDGHFDKRAKGTKKCVKNVESNLRTTKTA